MYRRGGEGGFISDRNLFEILKRNTTKQSSINIMI